jgi:hypothetical protein
MNTTRYLLAVGALAIGGCTGSISGSKDGEAAPPLTPATGGSTSVPDATPTPTTGTKAWPTSGLRRLTREQYRRSVQQLLGVTADPSLQLPPDEVADEGFEFRSVGASRATTAPLGVAQYDALARALAHDAFLDPTARQGLVGCAPSSASDECVTAFLKSFGRRALRRPLDATELARYQALVSSGASALGIWRGLEAAVAAFLQSPSFLYRAELGTAQAGDTRLKLDAFEVASRLSFLLHDSTPDDALLDAAAAGVLATPDGIDAQLTRLLAEPAAQATLTDYFREWLGFRELAGLPKDAQIFPGYTPELADAMEQELAMYVSRELLTGARSVLSIYSTQSTYVNATLAMHYGLPAPAGAGFQLVSLPAESHRAGLLTFAGLLAGNSRATMTSPTLRGRYVRERLLCGTVPPPPPSVVATLPPPPADGSVETMRERLARHATEPACAGCHQLMDPLGLALEHFDAIGQYRELDQGRNIDASGTLDGEPFVDAVALGQKLEHHPDAVRCVGGQFARHAWGQAESAGEAWIFDELAAGFARGGYTIDAMVRQVVHHESFSSSGGLR